MDEKVKKRVLELRKTQTTAETKLWYALRNRRFCEFKFRRQRPIGFYIVDFVCLKHRLIIELDGSQHMENKEYDDKRTEFLEKCGYRVMRFWNNQILKELNLVLDSIYLTLVTLIRLPAPSPKLGEGSTIQRYTKQERYIKQKGGKNNSNL